MKKVLLMIQKFADDKFVLNSEKLIAEFTKDDAVDYSKLNESIQTQVNGFLAKSKPDEKELKTKFKTEIETEIFSELKIEGVTNGDQFNSHVETLSKSTDENGKKVTELNGLITVKDDELKKLQDSMNDIVKSSKTNEFKADVYENGFNPKFLNSVQAEFQAKTSGKDEFDKKEVYDNIKKEFPEFVNSQTAVNLGNQKPPGNAIKGFGDVKKDGQGFFGGKVNV